MKEKLDGIKFAALRMIEDASDTARLNDVRVKYLGKSGEISAIMRDMANVPKEDRPAMGKLVNEMRGEVEAALTAKTQRSEERRVGKECL